MSEQETLTPLANVTLREQAKTAIRKSIIRGELESGETYSASFLASQLNISATPVREALFDLASAGLVEPVQSRGFKIPQFSRRDWDELRELISLIEVPIVASLVNALEPKDFVELRELANRIGEAARDNDSVRYLELDRDFHTRLLMKANNRRATALVNQLRDQTRIYRISHKYETSVLLEGARHHEQLLDAIERGDKSQVRRIMREHVSLGSAHVSD